MHIIHLFKKTPLQVRFVLSNFFDPGIKKITQDKIDNLIFAPERYPWFRAIPGQWTEALSLSSRKHNANRLPSLTMI